MITFRHRGDLSKTKRFLANAKDSINLGMLDKYGREGVSALASATPVESGKTADAWYYEISGGKGYATITFGNSHVNQGVPIAIILEYGHGTGTGGWVQGRHYIAPVIQPLFDKIADDAWREVTKL